MDRLNGFRNRTRFRWNADGGVNMIWGDAGMLYFWIREQDPAARDFSRVWVHLQCG